MAKLTEKQKRFCDYYIQTGDATNSAIKAGYSKKTAYVIGYENLNKPHLMEYIKERNDVIASTRIADMVEVKELWTTFMRDKEADPKDRLSASDKIAKTNGAYLDRVEHSGKMTINIEADYGEDES